MVTTVRLVLSGGEKIITWTLSERLTRILAFLFGLSFGIGARYYVDRRKRIKAQKNLQKIPKGGVDLETVLQPELVYKYKVVDKTLSAKIREILGNAVGNLVVDHRVVIFAASLINPYQFPLSLFGYNFGNVAMPINELLSAGYIASATGLGYYFAVPFLARLLSIPSLPFSGTILGLIILTGTTFGIPEVYNHFISNSQQSIERIVTQLPTVSVEQADEGIQKLVFTDETKPSKASLEGDIYIRNSDGEKIRVPKSWLDKIAVETDFEIIKPAEPAVEKCVHKERQTGIIFKDKTIEKVCERPKTRKYVPLSERTQTLADLKKYDDTENLTKVQPKLDRYERKAQEYRHRRESIRAGRTQKNSNSVSPSTTSQAKKQMIEDVIYHE